MHNAPEGSYEYALIKSGPDLPTSETETAASAIEVRIRWGRSLLHVQHLTPKESFYLGEDESSGAVSSSRSNKALAIDYFVPQQKLGAPRAPLVIGGPGGASAIWLPNAVGSIRVPGQCKLSLQEAIANGMARPCSEVSSEVSGAHQVPLMAGTVVEVQVELPPTRRRRRPRFLSDFVQPWGLNQQQCSPGG